MHLPLSPDDDKSLHILTGQSSVIRSLIDEEDIEVDGVHEAAPEVKVAVLINRLKTYLHQMADEVVEYGDPTETARLQSEAVGICLAIREIGSLFPHEHLVT